MALTPIEEDLTIKDKSTGAEYQMKTGEAYDPSIYNIVGSDSIQPTGDIEYNEPEDTPPFDITKLDFETTDPEKEAQSLTEELQSLNLGLVGESAFTAQQEEIQGIESLKKAKQDLDNQLKVLQAEAAAIPLQVQQEFEGSGGTMRALQGRTTARLRVNAIKALTVSALSQAANGNLATALDLVDRAVSQKYDPIREEINAKMKNLDLILRSPEYTQAEKKRAAEQQAILANQEAEVAAQEAEQKEIWNIATNAATKGADAITLQRIQAAETKEEALRIATEAGVFIEEKKAELLKTQIVDMGNRKVLINTQTGETIKDLGATGSKDANSYVWLDELVVLNPDASYEEIFSAFKKEKGGDLSDSELRNYLEVKDKKPVGTLERKTTDTEIEELITDNYKDDGLTKEDIIIKINNSDNLSQTDKERALELVEEKIPDELNEWLKKIKSEPDKYEMKDDGIWEIKKFWRDKKVYSF